MKILVTGDWHLDEGRCGITDPETDLDLRVKDFFKAIDHIIDHAIENKIDLFILNGDLFKGRTSTHYIETLVAERFRRIASHMPFIINLGNHDYTPKQLAYGIHTYSILERFGIDNVKIYTDITHLKYDGVDLVLYPYYDLKRVEFKTNKELIDWIEQTVGSFDLNQNNKIFVGHGTPHGTIMSDDHYFDLEIIDEPVLPKRIFDKFDMVLFSHIHRGHAISPKLQHVGSPERVSFAEAGDDKGFIICDTEARNLEWVSTNPRPMLDIKLNLLDREYEDPTTEILNQFINIPNINEYMIKIEVKCSESTESRVDHVRLKEALENTFYYKPTSFETPRTQLSRNVDVTERLQPVEAMEKVINAREDLSEDDKRQIMIRGRGLLTKGSENETS